MFNFFTAKDPNPAASRVRRSSLRERIELADQKPGKTRADRRATAALIRQHNRSLFRRVT